MAWVGRAIALAAVLIAPAVVLLQLGAPLWAGWSPASCMPDACFCEARHAHGFVQPTNTWSSFGYVIVGSMLIARHADLVQRWLGTCAIVIGLGSALYHASLTFIGQFFDVFGMYLLTAFMLAYAGRNWPVASGKQFANGQLPFAYMLLVASLSLALWFAPESRRWLFATVLTAALVAEWAYRRVRRPFINTRWFWMGLLAFAVGYAIWILDNTRSLCDPVSWLQGHALWHVLGASSIVLLAKYYGSECVTET